MKKVVNEKLLILDIDEALIHCNYSLVNNRAPDLVIKDGKSTISGWNRPKLSEFVEYALANFHVGVWSSGSPDYVAEVSKHIFKDRVDELKFIWARDRCTVKYFPSYDIYSYSSQQVYLKNLNKIKRSFGYRLENMLVVDDSPEKHMNNYGNLIRVSPWEAQESKFDDEELSVLTDYLHKIKDADNFRKIEKRRWFSEVLLEQMNNEKAVKKMKF